MSDQPTRANTATHTLRATAYDTLWHLTGDVVCHNDPDDPDRDCRWGEEVARGECPDYQQWLADRGAEDGYPDDWPCRGWWWEGVHVHARPGCGVEWQIENVGEETVAVERMMWAGDGCTVWWNEGCAVLSPVSAEQPLPPVPAGRDRPAGQQRAGGHGLGDHRTGGLVRRTIAALTASVVLAGCDATVTTGIDVLAVDDVPIETSIVFSGDAAAALARGDNLARLVDAFEGRTGTRPDVVRHDGTLGVRQHLRYDQLASVADVTGIADVRVVAHGDGSASLEVDLQTPNALVDAVTETDSTDGVVAAAALAATQVGLQVRMAAVHHVQVLDQASVPVAVDDTSATVTQRLSVYSPGTVVVTGAPGRASRASRAAVPAAVALAAAIAGVWAWRRR